MGLPERERSKTQNTDWGKGVKTTTTWQLHAKPYPRSSSDNRFSERWRGQLEHPVNWAIKFFWEGGYMVDGTTTIARNKVKGDWNSIVTCRKYRAWYSKVLWLRACAFSGLLRQEVETPRRDYADLCKRLHQSNLKKGWAATREPWSDILEHNSAGERCTLNQSL